MDRLLLLALLVPWLALLTLPWWRVVRIMLVLAPVPLILLALIGDGGPFAHWLLLGSNFAVDALNRPLLLLAGAGWMLAGLYAADTMEQAPRRFAAFWSLTLAGQALVLLAADLASFYAGYATMTLAAYGLVVHVGSVAAWRAGRVYLVLSLGGEMLVLSGLLLLGAALGNIDFATLSALPPAGGLGALLLLAGFAVKLGVVPLHVWLPLAHPVAPVPASAVLSGLLVKAGLLGMLRLLPPGSLPEGPWLLLLGLLTAGYGAVVGLTQTRLKTVLAYSTVSQMGFALAGFAALQQAVGSASALAALGLFALHHGLNKIALFLAAGHRLDSTLSRLLFVLPALSLVGLPLSSGALAKSALKDTLHAAGFDAWLPALAVGSVLTAMLLLHAWKIARQAEGGRERVHPAWLLASVAGLLVPWGWLVGSGLLPDIALWSALWPALLALPLYLAMRGRWPAWPEGDLLQLVENLLGRLLRRADVAGQRWKSWQLRLPAWSGWPRPLERAESALARLQSTGAGLLVVLLGLYWLLRG